MISSIRALEKARNKFYEIAGGGIGSADTRTAALTTNQRIGYFRSSEFRRWVAAEKAAGRQVFWLKDVDMTQAAGDIFTFFFKWRADNGKFSARQLRVIERGLLALPKSLRLNENKLSPYDVLRLWQNKEAGKRGISLLDVWNSFYWPSQVGMTKAEKLEQVTAFAPHYVDKVYPGVPDDNRALEEAGVHVVIVSNGDEELAAAVAPILGIKPENVVGSPLQYDANGRATGGKHSYEVFAEEWAVLPQPGKPINFHYWLHKSRGRWGWNDLDERNIVIGGRDGDSASADGGMMILLPWSSAIGNFMVNTPGAPDRIKKFHALASRYGWTKGQFITLNHSPSKSGAVPE